MVMVWGEEMDSETHSNKKCGGRQKRERHVLTKKKNDLSSKKIQQKKIFFVSMVPMGIDRSPPPGGV
jgi:hypothetical protein